MDSKKKNETFRRKIRPLQHLRRRTAQSSDKDVSSGDSLQDASVRRRFGRSDSQQSISRFYPNLSGRQSFRTELLSSRVATVRNLVYTRVSFAATYMASNEAPLLQPSNGFRFVAARNPNACSMARPDKPPDREHPNGQSLRREGLQSSNLDGLCWTSAKSVDCFCYRVRVRS